MTHEAGIEAALDCLPDYPTGLHMERALEAYLSASRMVLVPREPTIEMLRAADNVTLTDEEIHAGPYEFDRAVYMALVAHAPDPFKSKP